MGGGNADTLVTKDFFINFDFFKKYIALKYYLLLSVLYPMQLHCLLHPRPDSGPHSP